MLSPDAITRLSHALRTSELNVRREYVQHLFLSSLYRSPHADALYFKGGTALRLLYRSPRFSEDLDFDASENNVRGIEDAIAAALEDMQRGGANVALDEVKKTSGGHLSIMRFLFGDETIPIRTEISLRKRNTRGTATLVTSAMIPDYTLVQLAEEDLVAGKIDALLSRKKPRDFYDFYFLLRRNMLPKKTDKTKLFADVIGALRASDIDFSAELKTFLPKDHHRIIRDFKTALEREIKRFA